MSVKIKVSDYIAQFLRVQEINHVFEVAGGMITHILDSLYRDGFVNIVSVHHEQAAAFAADAYGRITGKPGIALATSGPGATNLLTGIASCYFDSSPALFITGQVNIHEQKNALGVRQLGFQETDIVSMAESITKKTYRVKSADDIENIFNEAYEIAISDRPGPVLIDLPMNLQRLEITTQAIRPIFRKQAKPATNINSLNDLIARSQRPLILAGGGINAAGAKAEFIRFVELLNVPVVTSLQALDVLSFDHPLLVGFIGSYGNRWANIALGTADLVIVIGSRLDIRQTGADVEGFQANKTIIHIDCDENEINNRVKNCIPIIMDIKNFLQEALITYQFSQFPLQNSWLQEIVRLKASWPDTAELRNITGINPNEFMHMLARNSHLSCGFIADVGSHQMWAAQSLEINSRQFFITSAGMGAMGFALPAAIGASLALGKQPVVVIAGDGGFQMNIQELQTVIRNKIPLKIIVVNNKTLGMIRQFQDSYFEGRHQSTYWGYSAPDFETLAHAYGIPSKTINKTNELPAALAWLWECIEGPTLLQVMIDPHVNVYPKIAFGKPITEMEPFATPTQMEAT